MMSFNLVVLTGNVGHDPEPKELEGTTVTSFRLAIDTYKGKDASGKAKEEAMWVRVNAWGKLVESVSKLVKKGTPVLVSGEPQIRKYTDKSSVERTSVEIWADKVKILCATPWSHLTFFHHIVHEQPAFTRQPLHPALCIIPP